MYNLILTLRQLFQEAAVASTPQKRVQGIVSRVKSAMDVAACSLYLEDEEEILTLVATEGLNPKSVGRIRLRLGEGLVGWIAQTQHPQNLESASEDPHFLHFPESGEDRFEAFLGAPVVSSGKLVGVLVVEQRERRKFSEEEESFLITVAAHLGTTDLTNYQSDFEASRVDQGKQTFRQIKGVSGAPGVGVGRIVLLSDSAELMTVPDSDAEDVDTELELFRCAVAATLEDLETGQRKMAENVSADMGEVFSIYQMLLQGDDFSGEVERGILSGKTAATALRTVVTKYVERFEEMEDSYLRARAEDIRNLGSRVYTRLRNESPNRIGENEKIVLVGGLVSIADIAEYPIEQLAGIVSMEGSTLSHTAVMANALGLAAVMGIGHVSDFQENAPIIVDGYHGHIFLYPPPEVANEFSRLIEFERALKQDLAKLRDLPAQTPDGFLVHLYANSGLVEDLNLGLTQGAEGIGLYRSEIPFLVKETFPSEEEQLEIYRTVLETYKGMPVIMRTLDVGSDKVLPYYPYDEENPALGWRGVRFALDNSAVFMTQIRAMLRASEGIENLHIMLPMVSLMAEVDAFTSLLDSACAQLAEEGFTITRPKVGIMAEVPAISSILPFLAGKIDFVSIGSNDLSQYILAADRSNPHIPDLCNHFHPAVLQAIGEIVEQTNKLGIPISICGEMASDPCAVVLLLGMGIDTLSMSAFNILRIKWLIRTVSRDAAIEQLALARRNADPAITLEQLRDFLITHGLESLLEPKDISGSLPSQRS